MSGAMFLRPSSACSSVRRLSPAGRALARRLRGQQVTTTTTTTGRRSFQTAPCYFMSIPYDQPWVEPRRRRKTPKLSKEEAKEAGVNKNRSSTALRIEQLIEAKAMRYPRWEPRAERLSASEFMRKFQSVKAKPVPEEVEGAEEGKGKEAEKTEENKETEKGATEKVATSETPETPQTAKTPETTEAKKTDKPAGTTKVDKLARRIELSGRLMSVNRLSKKLVFLKLQDEGLQVQVMCHLQRLEEVTAQAQEGEEEGKVDEESFTARVKLLRRGDHVAATGRAIRSSTGQLTLEADALPRLVAPTLVPLPTRLLDGDTRAQKRHIDLLVNPGAAATALRLRAQLVRELRQFLEERRFIEVPTPILADLAGGATARPFTTAHESGEGGGAGPGAAAGTSTGARPLSLRIAPELWLKRLVVGGFDRVYEIGPAFRNEGIDATHNPEFTTCEFYAAYWTLPMLIDETKALFQRLANSSFRFFRSPHGADYRPPTPDLVRRNLADPDGVVNASTVYALSRGQFREIEFVPALEAALGFTLPDLDHDDAYYRLRERLYDIRHPALETGGGVGLDHHAGGGLINLLDRLAATHLEPLSHTVPAYDTGDPASSSETVGPPGAPPGGPLFITHHPAIMSPLAKSFTCPTTGQRVAARAEFFVDGRELVNMYEEENDPAEQRRKMVRQATNGSDESPAVDESYLSALQSGLPPTGGWGCGIERLAMLFGGRRRISDCLSFGTLRHVVSMK